MVIWMELYQKMFMKKKEEILKSALLKDCNELQYLKKELDGKDTLSDRINNFRNTLKNNQIFRRI